MKSNQLSTLLALLLVFFVSTIALADSTTIIRDSSVSVADDLLLKQNKQEEQRRLDSVVTAQLKVQLAGLSTDSKQRNELEAKLRQMTTRDSLKQVRQQANLAKLKASAKGYPVAPFEDTLFYIYTKIGPYRADDRAKAISQRIQKLADKDFFSADSLGVLVYDDGSDVFYGREMNIMSVSALDAQWFGTDVETLATDYLKDIKEALLVEREANSFINIAKRIGLVLLTVAVIVFLINLIGRLFKRSARWIDKNKTTFINGLTFRQYQLFTPFQFRQFALGANRIVRIAVSIFAVYLSLPILFSIFPETRGYTYTLLSWVLSPAKSVIMSILGFLPDLFTILVIYFFTSYALKLIAFFFREIEKGELVVEGFFKEWARPTFMIVKVMLYAFMLVIIFPYLPGSDSPAFQGVSVFLGILLSLGSSSAISNVISGIVITYMRPFKLGDRIRINDIVGDVREKNLLIIRVRNIKNEDITIPNQMVLNNHTINYSSNAEDIGLILHTTVTIGYDVPYATVHQLLIDAALATEMIQKEPLPFVLQTSLDDFYVSYQLNAYCKDANKQALIYSEMHRNIQDQFNKAGIEIMSPHYKALRDGNQTTVAADQVPSDYVAPSFRVKEEKK